jgi:uncharacterized glyoxalase superfamily protein PhnB
MPPRCTTRRRDLPGPPAEVVKPFEETHWGTQEMHVRDPDGRIWSLQAPPKVQQ